MADWQQSGQNPWMVRFVIKMGLANTRKQAESILLTVAVICIGVTIWTFFSNDKPIPRPEDDPNYEPPIAGR